MLCTMTAAVTLSGRYITICSGYFRPDLAPGLRRKFVELLMCTGLQLIIVEQYIQPTIANGLTPWKELQWPKLIERVLKLSLPTVYGWLIMFYSVFHLLLNIIAELTGFEDREFYKVRFPLVWAGAICEMLIVHSTGGLQAFRE